jgi:hypothetical protein
MLEEKVEELKKNSQSLTPPFLEEENKTEKKEEEKILPAIIDLNV